MGDLPVVRGHTFVRVTSVFSVLDQQAVVLGYLKTAHPAHQFSAAKQYDKHSVNTGFSLTHFIKTQCAETVALKTFKTKYDLILKT